MTADTFLAIVLMRTYTSTPLFNSWPSRRQFRNAEGEPNQSFFRCDAAVCAEQKMEKEVNAV